ncbi:MAG TPA: IPT/TIG domain-containing protein, partial [Solirubrobacteraceae bacterium]|nr:IPT/TIG domain-containing protein [Solirubrobacteraceae bacterium]
LEDGTVMAWGSNGRGQLGDGTTTNSDVPVAVSGLTEVVGVSAGLEHAVALLSDGEVRAWGANFAGQLGNGEEGFEKQSDVPVSVLGLKKVSEIAAGGFHTLALLASGTVESWGDNSRNQLGDGSCSCKNEDTPVAVKELSEVSEVAAGVTHSQALLTNGTVDSWGDNFYGDLGRGEESDDLPRPVTGLSGVTSIAAGAYNGLARLSDGGVVAWGAGPLGDGTPWGGATPTIVSGLSAIAAISGGGAHNLALGPPAPVVSNLTPHSGPPSGGTSVSIVGSDFSGATAVTFGSTSATSFIVNSSTSITATAPAGSGVVDVEVTSPEGTSAPSSADRFSYVSAPPEFGRCLKVAKGSGRFSATCTTPLAGGSYEWTTEVPHNRFTMKLKAGTAPLRITVAPENFAISSKLVCTGANGSGELSGTKEVKNVAITLTGCERFRGTSKVSEGQCSSEGAASGAIVLSTLEGVLGLISTTLKEGKEIRKAGLDLYPAGRTGLLFDTACIGTLVAARGSVIGTVAGDKMSPTGVLAFAAGSGKQKPQGFEGEPRDVLEGTLISGSVAQMGLQVALTQTNEEAIEINAYQ